jgi:hypothetical protein
MHLKHDYCRTPLLSLPLVVGFIVAGLVSETTGREEPADVPAAVAATGEDDGWRRTSEGWEHVSLWRIPPRERSEPARPIPWHPLWMAVGQIAISVGCLLASPRYELTRQEK